MSMTINPANLSRLGSCEITSEQDLLMTIDTSNESHEALSALSSKERLTNLTELKEHIFF